ncbi:hypothetical protein BC832DRAFT_589923 [Gaertneriomyces semiglobifer]|nr:hypothetical protein BC832DRAFT_589923 [Gaertneriomyces semiglobifer]
MRLISAIIILLSAGIPAIDAAGSIDWTCLPDPCPPTLLYSDNVTLTLSYAPGQGNVVLDSVTFTSALLYPDGFNATYTSTVYPENPRNFTLLVSPLTQIDWNDSRNTGRLSQNSRLVTDMLWREKFQHDGTLAGAAGGRLLDLAVFANSSGRPITERPTGTRTDAPRATVVLQSGSPPNLDLSSIGAFAGTVVAVAGHLIL